MILSNYYKQKWSESHLVSYSLLLLVSQAAAVGREPVEYPFNQNLLNKIIIFNKTMSFDLTSLFFSACLFTLDQLGQFVEKADSQRNCYQLLQRDVEHLSSVNVSDDWKCSSHCVWGSDSCVRACACVCVILSIITGGKKTWLVPLMLLSSPRRKLNWKVKGGMYYNVMYS